MNACIAGGVIYAGLKTLIKRRPRKNTAWLIKLDNQALRDSSPTTAASRVGASETTTSHYLIVTSVSLGLSASGALFYAPLSLSSVPLTVYGAIPMFERAYGALFTKGQPKMALVESVAAVGALATQHYVLASLITWLHYYLTLLAHRLRHLNALLRRGLEYDYSQFLAQASGIKPHSVWVLAQGVEVGIPFEQLRVGDIMVVHEGDVIAVEGVVVEGTAEVSLFLATGQARLVGKKTGDRIAPSTIVWSGKLCIRVERL